MRVVARGTAFGRRLMFILPVELGFTMATEAYQSVRLLQEIGGESGMRGMTIETFTGHDDCLVLHPLGEEAFGFGMALHAKSLAFVPGAEAF